MTPDKARVVPDIETTENKAFCEMVSGGLGWRGVAEGVAEGVAAATRRSLVGAHERRDESVSRLRISTPRVWDACASASTRVVLRALLRPTRNVRPPGGSRASRNPRQFASRSRATTSGSSSGSVQRCYAASDLRSRRSSVARPKHCRFSVLVDLPLGRSVAPRLGNRHLDGPRVPMSLSSTGRCRRRCAVC